MCFNTLSTAVKKLSNTKQSSTNLTIRDPSDFHVVEKKASFAHASNVM